MMLVTKTLTHGIDGDKKAESFQKLTFTGMGGLPQSGIISDSLLFSWCSFNVHSNNIDAHELGPE